MSFRTLLSAPEAILARLARQITLKPFPATSARALGRLLIARTVVVTIALVLTILTVSAAWAERLTMYT